ncbi:MAG: tetratricopeptide repeat protein [Saprospiraceae bacterium]
MNPRTYKRSGVEYFDNSKFNSAAEALTVYRRYKPEDSDIWYPLAVSLYKTNDLEGSRVLFEGLIRTGKKMPEEAYLYLGRIDHHEGKYDDAAKHYKRYLRSIDDSHPLYKSIVDDIRRLGVASRMGPSTGSVAAYSENLGTGINTIGDEFHPLLSPNYQDRMYFASIREGVSGGNRDDKGLINDVTGVLRADMFSGQVENGRWTSGNALSYLLNSAAHDIALDFGMGGRVLLFWKGNDLYAGDILVDTFRSQAEARNLFAPEWDGSPLNARAGDKDPHLFKDTLVLFVSRMDGGYGGYDVYSATRRNGVWQKPLNLGPTINSAYDERSPYLCNDGRTLFYSSNRVDASIGGFDVFKAHFDDRKLAWGLPENAGRSVNSAGDELNFRVANSGLEAYFDSDIRTTSLGGRDIYAAYFKEKLREQELLSRPISFLQVLEKAQKSDALIASGENSSAESPMYEKPLIPVSVKLEPLKYGNDDNIITPGNLQKSSSVMEFLGKFPGSKVVITTHSDDSDAQRFRTYFGIKRAEQFAEYLVERGVAKDRIQLMSVGSTYPMADNFHNDQPSIQGQRFNRRIELHVVPGDDYLLSPEYNDPRVPDFIANDMFDVYRELQDGVVFRIEVAELKQRYENASWLNLPSPSIQSDPSSGKYRYSGGAYIAYRSARQMADELLRSGFSQAKVVAYLNGLRLNDSEVASFAEDFPELGRYQTAISTEE